ncbi:MAG: IclR family transcriptional regulator [Pseudomonadota bacterium]
MTLSVQGAQSFSRSIAILQMFADSNGPLSRPELAEKTDLTRPTLYRIIASLEAEGLIESAGRGRYRLGARLVHLARSALAQNDVRQVAGVELERLRDATGETVHLAIPSGDSMIYVDKVESSEVVRMMSTIGQRIALHSTSVGKAYLSALPSEKLDAFIDNSDLQAVTEHTVTDPSALKSALRDASHLGFAREEQENEKGIVCFGSPVRSHDGTPVGAISVSVPMFRLDEDKAYGAAVARAAASVSKRLGHR